MVLIVAHPTVPKPVSHAPSVPAEKPEPMEAREAPQ